MNGKGSGFLIAFPAKAVRWSIGPMKSAPGFPQAKFFWSTAGSSEMNSFHPWSHGTRMRMVPGKGAGAIAIAGRTAPGLVTLLQRSTDMKLLQRILIQPWVLARFRRLGLRRSFAFSRHKIASVVNLPHNHFPEHWGHKPMLHLCLRQKTRRRAVTTTTLKSLRWKLWLVFLPTVR